MASLSIRDSYMFAMGGANRFSLGMTFVTGSAR